MAVRPPSTGITRAGEVARLIGRDEGDDVGDLFDLGGSLKPLVELDRLDRPPLERHLDHDAHARGGRPTTPSRGAQIGCVQTPDNLHHAHRAGDMDAWRILPARASSPRNTAAEASPRNWPADFPRT